MLSNYLKEYYKERKISQYEIIDRVKINLSLNNKRKLTAAELMKLAIEFDIDINKIKEKLSAK